MAGEMTEIGTIEGLDALVEWLVLSWLTWVEGKSFSSKSNLDGDEVRGERRRSISSSTLGKSWKVGKASTVLDASA
jgi:hypothetical protein